MVIPEKGNNTTVTCTPLWALWARDQVGAIAAASASRGRVASPTTTTVQAHGHAIAQLLWAYVVATQVTVIVNVVGRMQNSDDDYDGDEDDEDEDEEDEQPAQQAHPPREDPDSRRSMFFRVSPLLLGGTSGVELRPWRLEWVNDTHVARFSDDLHPRLLLYNAPPPPPTTTMAASAAAPATTAISSRGDRGRGNGWGMGKPDGRVQGPRRKRLTAEISGVGRFHVLQYEVSEAWIAECGSGSADEDGSLWLLIQPSNPPPPSSSATSTTTTGGATTPTSSNSSYVVVDGNMEQLVVVRLPYAKRTHGVRGVMFNKPAPNEVILSVSPWAHKGTVFFVLIDAAKTHATKSLTVIGSTCFQIADNQHISKAVHVRRNTGSGFFVAECAVQDDDHSEVWHIEETTGEKRVLATSDDPLSLSWLGQTKFIVCHSAPGEPAYEVWDCSIIPPRSLSCNTSSTSCTSDMTSVQETVAESCCVIQPIQGTLAIRDALTSFTVLTVTFPQWNSLFIDATFSF
ncbi:hypothetical protein Pelo_7060 [Pelomyxa schiedti]|nr:hypothetical protein Pelo_7060 [Pelomyxa schiedti]